MKILILFLLLLSSFTLKAQISYLNSFEQALELAKKEQKFVMVKFYGESCNHCQDLQKMLTVDSIAQLYNKNFIFFKINSENLTDKDQAFLTRYKFNIDQIPYLFFFDADGNFIHFSIPKIEAVFLVKIVKTVKTPSERTSYLAVKYQQGARDQNTLKVYCKLAHLLSNDSLEKQLGEDIFLNYPKDELLAKSGIVTLAKYIKHIDNGLFKLWMDNYSNLDALAPEFKRADKEKVFRDIIVDDINNNKFKWEISNFELALYYLKLIDPTKNPYQYFWQEMSQKYLQEGKEKEALKIGQSFVEADKMNFSMNLYAVTFYLRNIKSKEELSKIKNWIDMESSLCTDLEMKAKLKAQLVSFYYKMGQQKEAEQTKKELEKFISDNKLSSEILNEILK